jgi:hypothetical protein
MLHAHSIPAFRDWLLESPENFSTFTDLAIGGALHVAADARRFTQTTTLGWAHSYFDWADRNLQKDPMYTFRNEDIDFIAKLIVVAGIPLSYLPFVAVTASPYLGPWAGVTGPVAFAIDAYNIYRYFD